MLYAVPTATSPFLPSARHSVKVHPATTPKAIFMWRRTVIALTTMLCNGNSTHDHQVKWRSGRFLHWYTNSSHTPNNDDPGPGSYTTKEDDVMCVIEPTHPLQLIFFSSEALCVGKSFRFSPNHHLQRDTAVVSIARPEILPPGLLVYTRQQSSISSDQVKRRRTVIVFT
jgi:hypothetical protein